MQLQVRTKPNDRLLRLVDAVENSLTLQSIGRACLEERMEDLESDFGVRWTSGSLMDTVEAFCLANEPRRYTRKRKF